MLSTDGSAEAVEGAEPLAVVVVDGLAVIAFPDIAGQAPGLLSALQALVRAVGIRQGQATVLTAGERVAVHGGAHASSPRTEAVMALEVCVIPRALQVARHAGQTSSVIVNVAAMPYSCC